MRHSQEKTTHPKILCFSQMSQGFPLLSHSFSFLADKEFQKPKRLEMKPLYFDPRKEIKELN